MAGHGRRPHVIGINTLFCLRRLPRIGNILRQAPRESQERVELETAIERLSQEGLLAAERLFAALQPSPEERPQNCFRGSRWKRRQETDD